MTAQMMFTNRQIKAIDFAQRLMQTASKVPSSSSSGLCVSDSESSSPDTEESRLCTSPICYALSKLPLPLYDCSEDDETKFQKRDRIGAFETGLKNHLNEGDRLRSKSIPFSIAVSLSSIAMGKNHKLGTSVRFDTSPPLVHATISVDEMSTDEIRSTWLQDDEYLKIRQRDEFLVFRAEQERKAATPKWICTRGLERKLTLESNRTKSRRMECLERVLLEQEEQWSYQDQIVDRDGYLPDYDDEAIAAASMEATKDCRIRALGIAFDDRQEVNRLWKDS